MTPAWERRLRKIASASAPSAIAEWRYANDDEDRFYAAPRAAMGAVFVGDYTLARTLGAEGLRLASIHQGNWHYGNALHFCHTALGLVELAEGNERAALEHLQQLGQTPGSPQLGSFGPSMLLARNLLHSGHFDEVLAFIRQCRSFWAMGARWLDIWEKKVERGAVPVFFQNLYR